MDLPREEWHPYLRASGASDSIQHEVTELLALQDDPRSHPLDPDPSLNAAGLTPGVRVGHYEIVRRLGAGGMGTVYLARDERLGRDVALKVLRHQPDQRARDRLLREARAAGALDHPSICAVHEVGSDPAVGDFLVMPYIEGGTLADRLARGPLRPTEAVLVCRQLAEALAVAHARGIVHRDLKPRNVAIDASGRPRLLDFGIARTLRPVVHPATMTTQVTEAGVVVGTPSYMSPEQIRGERVDARSDLFALGSVLYQCLTGQRAFDGQTAQEICGKVLHVTPPAPSSVRPDLGHEHDALCLRLLEREPARRFESAQEASGALRLLEGGSTDPVPTPAPPAVPWWRRPLLGLAAGLVLITVLALSQAFWPKHLPEAPPEARHWYEQGVDALRSDSFAVALSRLREAVKLFPEYVEAHARMAEAHAQLDDREAALQALVVVDKLVPNKPDLNTDERVRLQAIRASVLNYHDEALSAFADLTRRHPDDVGLRVDLAGAQEAAGRLTEAAATLMQAVAAHPQAAAARLRLGALQARLGNRADGLRNLAEAVRLYRVSANVEGEADAWLHIAAIANDATDLTAAKNSLQRAAELLGEEDRYLVLRLRARFQTALLLSSNGDFPAAQTLAAAAVATASENGLQSVAADGLISLADAFIVAGHVDQAEAALKRAIVLADERKATTTAMRARLQRSVILADTGDAAGAQDLATTASEYFGRYGFVRLAAQARNVRASISADLNEYDLAASLSEETLAYAERVDDKALAAESLETLTYVRTSRGDLPLALHNQARLSEIYKEKGNRYALPFSLVNQAALLIRLGRGSEADALLDEVDSHADGADASYARHTRKAAVLRALRAAIDGRYSDVRDHVQRARALGLGDEGDTSLLAAALSDYATSSPRLLPTRQRRSNRPTECSLAEACYWLASAALLRGDDAISRQIIQRALERDTRGINYEVEWRLLALWLTSDGGSLEQVALVKSALLHLNGWVDSMERYRLRNDLTHLFTIVDNVSKTGGGK